jgi:hypothetical protein
VYRSRGKTAATEIISFFLWEVLRWGTPFRPDAGLGRVALPEACVVFAAVSGGCGCLAVSGILQVASFCIFLQIFAFGKKRLYVIPVGVYV